MAERIWLGRITKAELEELQQVMVNNETVIETLQRTNLQSGPALVAIMQQSSGYIAQLLNRQAGIIQRAAARNSPAMPQDAPEEGGAQIDPQNERKANPDEEGA